MHDVGGAFISDPYICEPYGDIRNYIFPVPCPANLEEIVNNAVPHYAFKSHANSTVAMCSKCGRYIDLRTAEHTTVPNPEYPAARYMPCSYSDKPPKLPPKTLDCVICDQCGSTCRIFKLTKATAWWKMSKTVKVSVLNPIQGRILFQKFLIGRTVDPNTKLEYLKYYEYIRNTWTPEGTVYCCYREKYIRGEWRDVWDFDKYGTEFVSDDAVDDKTGIATFVVKIKDYPDLKYSMLDKYIRKNKLSYSSGVFHAIQEVHKRPWLEMVWKAGLEELYDCILFGRVNRSLITSKFVRTNIKLLQRINAGQSGAELIWRLRKNKLTIPPDDVLKAIAKGHYVSELEDCLKIENSDRMVKYFSKRILPGDAAGNATQLRGLFKDLRNMLVQLNPDGNIPDSLLFPTHLREVHDEASRRINELRMADENKRWGKIVHRLAKLEYVNADFGLAIVAPKKATDLTFEGATLGHCVGGYIGRVLQGYTTILFLRKVEDLNTPLGTIEFNNGRVVQCRGFHNKNDNLPPNYEDFLRDWQKHLKQQQAGA